MTSRSFRLETRSRARDEIKRAMQTVDKVRKWEQKWVDLGLSNSLKLYKWVPVLEETNDQDEEKENQPMEITEHEEGAGMSHRRDQDGNPVLPVITSVDSEPTLESQLVITEQALPELLLVSEDSAITDDPLGSLSSIGTSSVTLTPTLLSSQGPDGSGTDEKVQEKEQSSQGSVSPKTTQGHASNVATRSDVEKGETLTKKSSPPPPLPFQSSEKVTEELVESSVSPTSPADLKEELAASTETLPQPPLLHALRGSGNQKAYDLEKRLERPIRRKEARQSGSPPSDHGSKKSRSRSRSPRSPQF